MQEPDHPFQTALGVPELPPLEVRFWCGLISWVWTGLGDLMPDSLSKPWSVTDWNDFFSWILGILWCTLCVLKICVMLLAKEGLFFGFVFLVLFSLIIGCCFSSFSAARRLMMFLILMVWFRSSRVESLAPVSLKSFCHLHIENVNSWNQSACQCLSFRRQNGLTCFYLYIYIFV